MLKQSEADLSRTVRNYLTVMQNQGRLFYLRLNSGTFIQEGKKQRLIRGCPAGTSDLFILMNGTSYFIELKSQKGKLTESQLRFMELVEYQGGIYLVARDLEQVKRLVESQ